jgi:hypothetical protein
MRAFGLPHFGQTSRCGTVIFGVLLRFWRRSAGIDSGCIGVLLIISNRRQPVAEVISSQGNRPGCWGPRCFQKARPFIRETVGSTRTPSPGFMTLHARGRIPPQRARRSRARPLHWSRQRQKWQQPSGRVTIWSIVESVRADCVDSCKLLTSKYLIVIFAVR